MSAFAARPTNPSENAPLSAKPGYGTATRQAVRLAPAPEPKNVFHTSDSIPISSSEPADPGLKLMESEQEFIRGHLAALTSRECEVLLAICAGGTNDSIASRLCIALPTLRTHLMRLNQKLGTASKSDLIRHAAGILIDGYRSGVILKPLAPGNA